eukprot:TRINITY_DN64354_c0_g1_i1.p1 TRINITY_DN64354_c0_g1~~TRINITY_DN64354_c0_g1_i1.p1  ORF type:complete len:295 (+),score=45.10 TRINITY_DN64354_c0_g1_i1:125-886(+)
MDCTPQRTRRPLADPPSGAVKTLSSRSRHQDPWAALAASPDDVSSAKKPSPAKPAAPASGRCESPPPRRLDFHTEANAAKAADAATVGDGSTSQESRQEGRASTQGASEVVSVRVTRESGVDGVGLEFELGGNVYRVTDPAALATLTTGVSVNAAETSAGPPAAAEAPATFPAVTGGAEAQAPQAVRRPPPKQKRSLDDLRRAQRLRASQAAQAAQRSEEQISSVQVAAMPLFTGPSLADEMATSSTDAMSLA